jgi:hypothetical protein
MEIEWFDADQVFLSTTIGDTLTVGHTKWIQLEATGRAPNGAAFAQVRVVAAGLLATQAQYTDDALFTRTA